MSRCLLGPPGTTALHCSVQNMGCSTSEVAVRGRPRYNSRRRTGFPVCETHKLIPILQFAAQFSLVYALSSQNRSFLSLVLGCRRLSNLLECAERHVIHGQSAQKQQHRSVSNLSRSFFAKCAVPCVDCFESIKCEGIFVYPVCIRDGTSFL